MAARKHRNESLPAPRTEALSRLDQERAASLADEGGTAAAIVETQEPEHPDKDGAMQDATTRQSRRKPARKLPLLFVLGLSVLAVPAVRADVLLTPHVGASFGGDNEGSHLNYGGSLTFVGGDGGLGFTADFGFTPRFFGDQADKNNVTTLMGNLMFSSSGHVRIYGSAGLGLLKTRVQDAEQFFDVDSNELGFNAGGGLMFVPTGPVGFQADIRYFRNLTDPEPDNEFDVDLGGLHFWRATGGLIIRF